MPPIDTVKAKQVMKSMDIDQQALLQQLLSQLRAEQKRGLKIEEQNQKMMEQNVRNQEHLEVQIKMLKDRLGSTS